MVDQVGDHLILPVLREQEVDVVQGCFRSGYLAGMDVAVTVDGWFRFRIPGAVVGYLHQPDIFPF